MAITYTTKDGTVVTTLAQLADWMADRKPGATGNTPANAEVVVDAWIKPGTPQS